jgi:hypothetical protein
MTFFADLDGCDCEPTYYVVVRDGRRNPRRAGRQGPPPSGAGAADDRRSRQRRRLAPAAEHPLRDLGPRSGSARSSERTTVDSYRSTIAYANEAFGWVLVRRLRPRHQAELNEVM